MIDSTAKLAAALAMTAVLAVGCSDDGVDETAAPSPAPPAPTAAPSEPTVTPTSTPDSREWATCTSTRASLRVSYPAEWTARDYPDGGCAYFDPQPFDVERGTEAPEVAVRLDVESVAYDRVRSSYLEGEVTSQRETEVAGYDGLRIEDRDEGGPLGPKGRRLTYLADLGDGRTLVLTTNETDAEDFERAQQVLDEMAERLERAG